MKPIHVFIDFLKNNLEIFNSSREKTVWIVKIFIFALKRVSLRENVSLRVCLL